MPKTSRLLAAAAPFALAVAIALAAPARAGPTPECHEGPTAGSTECAANASVTGLESKASRQAGEAIGAFGTATGTSGLAAGANGTVTGQGTGSSAGGTESTALGQRAPAVRRAPRETQCRCPRVGPEAE